MTIRGIEDDHWYKMEEDISDTSCNLTPGWDWLEAMIAGLAPQDPENDNFCEEIDESLYSFLNGFKTE